MKVLSVTLLVVLSAIAVFAQQADTTRTDVATPDSVATPAPVETAAPAETPAPTEQRVFYGGELGLSFGSYFRIRIAPMVGLKLSQKLYAGVKVAYEHTEDSRTTPELTSNNYGGSVFARYRVVPRVYLHGEFAYMSYQYSAGNASSDREWVPFLLLGGGFVQPIGGNSSAYVEVLFDVLQDSKSPYEDWAPLVSVGVAMGF